MFLELWMSAILQQARELPAKVRPVDPIEVEECRRALREASARPDCNATRLAERLLVLGFPALDPAWDLLWSAERGEEPSVDLVGERIAPLEVLERVVLASPPVSRRRSLAWRIAVEPSAEEILWICDHLGRHGTWRDVDLVLGITRVQAEWLGLDGVALLDRARSALVQLLERDPTSFGALRTTVEVAPQDFGAMAVAALADCEGAQALETLSSLLDLLRIDGAAVAAAIETVGRRSLPPFDPYLLTRLREAAQSGDPRLRAASLRALGALRDDEAMPLQISGISDEHSAVRSAAATALAEQTGLRFGNDPQRWTSWYAGETAWWEASALAAMEQLTDEDPAIVVAALAEIVPHRLGRDRLARAVAGLLDHESAQLRGLACSSLAQLGSRETALTVVDRLADIDDSVRVSAHRCLETLFGLDLPPQVDAWKDSLEPSRPSSR